MAASGCRSLFAAGALAGLAIGAANALLVVAIGMTPLLATLASSVAVAGLVKVVTSNRRINVDGPVVTILRDGTVLGVPVAVLLMAAVGAGFVYALHWTRWGCSCRLWAATATRPTFPGCRPTGVPYRPSLWPRWRR